MESLVKVPKANFQPALNTMTFSRTAHIPVLAQEGEEGSQESQAVDTICVQTATLIYSLTIITSSGLN